MSKFETYQILCIEHGVARLYVEVIQVIPDRQLCWVRPLAMLTSSNHADLLHPFSQSNKSFQGENPVILHDLRQSPDLICPQLLFRAALDMEVIPVLAQLNSDQSLTNPMSADTSTKCTARHQLQEFVRCIWQAQPDAFQP